MTHAIIHSKRSHKWLMLLVALLVVVVFASTIFGVYRIFSPVPLNDMWGAYLDFYELVQAGDLGAWWRPHNEHRMIWSRVLFWLDLSYFQGNTVLQYVASFLLVSLSLWVFYLFINKIVPSEADATGKKFVALCCAALLFHWCQFENFTWAFQNCFFMAQAFPLTAFYLQAQYVSPHQQANSKWWLTSLLMGIASAGTLASGVFVLPLMLVYALLTRQTKARLILITASTVLCLAVFLKDYHAINYQDANQAALLYQPLKALGFVLLFLGGPLFHIAGQGKIGAIIAGLGGVIFIALTLRLFWQCTKIKSDRRFKGALLMFVLFIGLCALAAANRRANLGIAQALVSRYSTPALTGWVALMVAYADQIVPWFEKGKKQFFIPVSLMLLALLPFQSKALANLDDGVADRVVAALALAYQINDEKQIKEVFPEPSYALEVSKRAVLAKHSIFGLDPIKDAASMIGTRLSDSRSLQCQASSLTGVAIPKDKKWFGLTGVVQMNATDPTLAAVSTWQTYASVLDKSGAVVGRVILYRHPAHRHDAIAQGFVRYEVKGYGMHLTEGSSITLATNNQSCQAIAEIRQ